MAMSRAVARAPRQSGEPPVPHQRILTQAALADLADVPARSHWVRSGCVRLHVLDYGGDGVPLLVLPGITSPAVTMDFVARELTDLARPVVLDVRGRGLSDDAGDQSLDALAADVEAVIEQLGLVRPVLFGHSMGARVAAATAVRGKVALAGTLLVDPPMSGPGRGPYPTTLAAFTRQLFQARRGTDADEVAGFWPTWPRRELELRARWLASCSLDAIEGTHHGFENEDFFDWWPRVPGPTTLLYGADSPVVTAEGAAEAAAAHPGARMVRVPDAGHMVFWDNPQPALELLREALTRTVNAAPSHDSGAMTSSPPAPAETADLASPRELTHAPGYLARRMYQAYLAAWLHSVDASLTGPQFAVLQITGENPGSDQGSIASLAALDTSTMADVARRLENRGLLARTPSPSDARRKLLDLTDAGRATVHDANLRARRLDEELLRPIPPEQRDEVLRHLSTLADHWERLGRQD
ncbi:alpha/beta fold hydrolase [Streptomyces sp. SLBN-134]|uniref:alpha/beta fold hydrolase n=1 Tax=Streptomyces sp. SLBN-134 TaxID=2768456 RepID=UPI00117512D0|nr:alpha/beta fold hydrolase [Streptomyces sp. SLBN-134]TQL18974.1 pimeloyl-ACP methyl ester carboxylesterase [Streptomyces sp. SLBN-134]